MRPIKQTDFDKPVFIPGSSGIGGHPRGLTTLFFTELWERFSYYGMRAILILYMVAPLSQGGLGLETQRAASIYGTYTMAVYLLALPGGWIADRFIGSWLSVLLGGIIIATGHFTMVFTWELSFYLGLGLVAMGTGLLKPNISTMVGSLYSKNDPRRDGGFSIFFMGINIGAALAPIICGYLAQGESFKRLLASYGINPASSWHWGFAAAGVGMVIGLIQFLSNQKQLKNISLRAGTYSSSLSKKPLTTEERKRVRAIFIFFVFTVIFGIASEQAGSSLNLFAYKLTRTEILGWTFPSSWFQSVIPIYVIILAPLFSVLWSRMGRRQPSTPIKFSFSLFFLGLAFLLMIPASLLATAGKVSPLWLLSVFFLQEIGSVLLNTVGLSTVTKLAPVKLAGVMMGVWFLASAVANKLAGYVAGLFDENNTELLAFLFGSLAVMVLVASGILRLLTPTIRKLMVNVK